ncbi:DnaJ family molecular chaperone [Azoarcus sp. KH32C]|uniref:J domain-containing protein n=1 Tax=Azoarcus sp. KH32C TaxID=748247 RepID=UPI00023866E6|nr:J domain-containing protein [Azoarcus sp. KH32C]BAL23680.1 hypothetical protein AZKH_1358 [Azoarcus sp. KH32C]
MSRTRPYIQESAKELETLFESVKDDLPKVKRILAELKHRSTPSAVTLREKVERHLKGEAKTSKSHGPGRADEPPLPEQPSHHIVDCKGCNTRIRIPVKEVCVVYRCPNCHLSFEAEYRGGVMEIVFLPAQQEEHITEDSARSILGVAAGAPFAEIKTAWRRLSQQYHPDKHQGLPERLRRAAEIEMARINRAYQVLARASAEEF